MSEDEYMKATLGFQSQKIQSSVEKNIPYTINFKRIIKNTVENPKKDGHEYLRQEVKPSKRMTYKKLSRRRRKKQPPTESLYSSSGRSESRGSSTSTVYVSHSSGDNIESTRTAGKPKQETIRGASKVIRTQSYSRRVQNRTLSAAQMKKQYFKFRSLLPGAAGEGLQKSTRGEVEKSWELLSGSGFFNFEDSRSHSRSSSNGVGGFINKQQRSADESNGALQSGRLQDRLHPFLPPDIVLPFQTSSPVLRQNNQSPGAVTTFNSTDARGSIAKIVQERLSTGSRRDYDASILVDFLSFISRQDSGRNTRSRSPRRRTTEHSRRRGSLDHSPPLDVLRANEPRAHSTQIPVNLLPTGSESRGRIVQRKLNLTPSSQVSSITPNIEEVPTRDGAGASRATSNLEAPLLFSKLEDNASANISAAAPVSGAVAEEGGNTTDTDSTSSKFGPFSDGNDPSAGVSPPPLPPVLRASLYSYLLPRLMSLAPLTETIPGVPGLDYPIMNVVPFTNFYCENMPWPGFYADTEARCQTWHMCDLDGRQASFLCPNGTIFNQAFMVCDWWYNSDCQAAPYLYPLNERLFQVPELPVATQQHRTLTAQVLDTLFI